MICVNQQGLISLTERERGVGRCFYILMSVKTSTRRRSDVRVRGPLGMFVTRDDKDFGYVNIDVFELKINCKKKYLNKMK